MLSIKVDPHTHTLASGHAFSTIEENAIHAKEKGLEAIAMTDHFGFGGTFPEDEDSVFISSGTAMNMSALPKVIHGVRILAGTEIDIADFNGNLAGHNKLSWRGDITFADSMLDSREVAIASVHHFPGYDSGTFAQYTQMYCNVAANPKIDIIGHPIRNGIDYDVDEVLKACKQFGCIVEMNEHSFDFGDEIINAHRKFALKCAEMGVSIVVSSDAHSSFFVGDFSRALQLLNEISFPEELVANTTLDRMLDRLKK